MSSFEPFVKSALQKYKHPDITKSDVLAAITAFADLRPKYEDYVCRERIESLTLNSSVERWQQRMLLQLCGTIPVHYKGNVYNIPISVYLMDTHPYTAPIVFVTPTSTMAIKYGRSVDQHGQVDLPYLREWKYPNSELVGMIQILVIVFGEEPPVYTRSQATNKPQTPVQNPTWGRPYPPTGSYQTAMFKDAHNSVYPSGGTYSYLTSGNDSSFAGMVQAQSSPRSIGSDADQTTGSDSSTIDDELQELQKLQGLLRCKICKARRVAMTFLPCCHCVACEECGPKVQSCPICPKYGNGNKVQGTVKTIFAS